MPQDVNNGQQFYLPSPDSLFFKEMRLPDLMPQTFENVQIDNPPIVAFRPHDALRAEDLNGNFIGIVNHLERLENIIIKIYKKQELTGADLFFKSSVDLLYGKPEASGRYGLLKNKEK